MLRDLRTAGGKEVKFEDVTEYSISKDAKTLLYAVASSKEETNGVYSVVPGNDAAPATLLSGKGRYTKITWNFLQSQAAFLSDRDDAASKPSKFKAYLWDRKSATPAAIVGYHDSRLSRRLRDRRSGNSYVLSRWFELFVSCAPAEMVAAAGGRTRQRAATPAGRGAASDKAVADLWNWKDDYVQPMQKVRAAQERIALLSGGLEHREPEVRAARRSHDGRTRLPATMEVMRSAPTIGPIATWSTTTAISTISTSWIPRPARASWFCKSSVAAVVVAVAGRPGGGSPWAPDAKHVLAFRDKQWWSIQAPDGKTVNLTGNLGTAFFNEDHDTPDEPQGYGMAGWTKDSKWALVYDRYDVWAIAADGSTSRKITDGTCVQPAVPTGSADESERRGSRRRFREAAAVPRGESGDSRYRILFAGRAWIRGQPQKLLWGRRIIARCARPRTPTSCW